MGIVLITHYQRLLDEVQPDVVHIMLDGRIVESGGMDIVRKLELDGYDLYRQTAESGR
jgi:Fe-S cluster assembly ATP-binding protein